MKRLIVFFIGFSFIVQVNGQGGKYIIQNYNLMNEISLNGSVWCMVQDTTGILYFGADYGIVTYNGTGWSLISKDQTIVRSLMIDSRHRIFYGGFDDFGILEPNAVTGLQFRSLSSHLPDSLRIFGDIWSINECGGNIFFQARNLIFMMVGDTIKSLPVNDSYHRGFVINGKYIINQKGTGLTYFNGNSFCPLAGGKYFDKMVISSMVEISPYHVLIGTRKHGAFRYNSSTGTVSPPFPYFPETNDLLIRNNIYHGILLPDSTLAIGTLYGGTLILNPAGKILKVLNNQHGLRDNANYYLALTSDYNLWISTSNGISVYNINSPFILWDYTTGIDGVILDIEDFEGNIFVGSLMGLYEIPIGKLYQDPIHTSATCLMNSEVWDIRQVRHLSRNYLFLGTGNGLYRLEGQQPVRIRETGIVLKVLQPKSDADMILAFRSEELDVYRWKGSELNYLGTIVNLYNGLRTAVEDNKGFIWIGTRKSGVVRFTVSDIGRIMAGGPRLVDFNAKNIDRRIFHFNPVLTDVLEFQDQAFFSNSTGLYQFNYSKQDFEKCNLFGPEITAYGKMISTLNKDSHGNIWVGGEDIFLHRPDGTYTLDKLNFKQLKDIFSAFVFLHNPDQKTWIGGNNGVYLYDNSIRMKTPSSLQTLITKIDFNSDSTLYVNAPSLNRMKPETAISGKNNPLIINLEKSNSKITFFFSLPFFDSEKRTLYSYWLEGYSSGWSDWSGETSLTFSNLKPKAYCFRVRSKTIYNQIGKSAEVYFIVPRHWYYSEYAWAAYLIILVLAVYRIAEYISKNRIQKQLRIEDIIQKRIQESKRSQIFSVINSRRAADNQAAIQADGGLKPVPEGNQFLTKALKTLDAHMADHELTAGQFCQELGMSQARVYRKLISLTGMSINEFIRNIRLKKAAQLLVESDYAISEIAYLTGFGSPGYFTKCFRTEFGINPRDFAPNRKKE